MKIFIWSKKARKTISYCERPSMLCGAKPSLHICKDCHFTMKRNGEKCPKCGSIKMISCGLTARPPRKNASKKKWNEFWDVVFNRSHPKGCR